VLVAQVRQRCSITKTGKWLKLLTLPLPISKIQLPYDRDHDGPRCKIYIEQGLKVDTDIVTGIERESDSMN
jgi:hypothetical protein